jgi:hypothetical protein
MSILTESLLYVGDIKAIEAVLTRSTLNAETLLPVVAPVNVTSATITFIFTRLSDGELISKVGEVVSGADGHVKYTFSPSDYDEDFTPGNYKLAIRAELTSGDDMLAEARCCPALKIVEDPSER